MRLFLEKIRPLVVSTSNSILEKYFRNPFRLDERVIRIVSEEVWEVFMSCSDVKTLPKKSGRTFWEAMSHFEIRQESLAQSIAEQSDNNRKRKKPFSEKNVKKHIHDIMTLITKRVEKRCAEMDWDTIVRMRLGERESDA